MPGFGRELRRDFGRARSVVFVLLATAALAACASSSPRYSARESGRGARDGGLHGTDKPYEINGRWYYPKAQPNYDEIGLASWYGAAEHNRHTADGEVFDQYGLTAAHKTLPLPSIVEVTNLANGRRIRVRLNDRGPFADGRLIDLSRGAAEKLGFDRQGLVRVRVRYISPAPPLAAGGVMQARLTPRRAVIETPARAPVLSASPRTYEEAEAAPVAGPVLSASPSSAPPAPSMIQEPETDSTGVAEADYRVLVGAYATRDDARRAASRLGADVRSMIEPVERPDGVAYRVVLGGFLDEDDALAAQLRFNAAGFTQARVLKPF